ncbi:MAG: PorV/PorQ family protein [Saprospiraceae bacterium]|nr:MAG: hypothetical protein UZ08_BCD001001932 [Candidatus Parvibacillus calidus]MCC7149311.1 PorV/PorQ family protein [Saprospiraceae bacterium]WKZ63164.1 MAG: PorV/PorQ family protein [Saprospiraceae bacterium]
MKRLFTIICLIAFSQIGFAGNPDRQGSAGAGELLINPWARSAGLHTMNTAGISGIEATRLNIAGLASVKSMEIGYSHGRYLVGTGISTNALGLAKKIGKKGVFGLDFMSVNFGDIPVTTVNFPEGNGANFNVAWTNIGLSYAHNFFNEESLGKVSVGLGVRLVMESIPGISATGVAFDAGVQYSNGSKDNFKLGLALRNLGTPMRFRGEGFTVTRPNPNVQNVNLAYDQRSANYELPVVLNIGTSYDVYFADDAVRLTPMINFTSNSFSRDQLGGAVEVSAFKDLVQVRVAYKAEIQRTTEVIKDDVYSGLAFGATANLTINKETKSKVALDYAYMASKVWSGTHNIGVRINL